MKKKEKKPQNRDGKELPIKFNQKLNTILGAKDDKATKEANLRYELDDLRSHAHAITALLGAIYKESKTSDESYVTVQALVDTGKRRAFDIHSNVNSLEKLLNIRPV
jgi:hypothetical protein